jgi:hypothetical protein
MEQHLREKKDYKREDGNSEKDIEGGFSSVIDIEDGFHENAFLKQYRCYISVCLCVNPSVRMLLSTQEFSLSGEFACFSVPLTETTQIF